MTSAIDIRSCHLGDETVLALIGQATFLESFAGILDGQNIIAHCAIAHCVSTYTKWLNDPSYRLWLVEIAPGNAPIGYAVVAPADLPLLDISDRDLELKRIYLLSRFQGQGYGRKLVAEAILHAKQAGAKRLLLGVYEKNRAAIAFYERIGFRQIGTRKFNVGGREHDDWVMGISLKPD